MKTKHTIPLIAATYCGLCAIGSAFTLDFTDIITGTTLPPVLVINVAGYGDVTFTPTCGDSLIVDDTYASPLPSTPTSPSLNFDTFESVKITFTGARPIHPIFSFVGVNVGESFLISPGANPSEYSVRLTGEPGTLTSGAGLYAIGFTAVPEPSAAMLGLLGAAMLVVRRKR